jgi:Rrf2 family protein
MFPDGRDIPVKYLEQLIQTLKSVRLVHSVRGAKGGNNLPKQPEEISLGTIVRLFEGKYELISCICTPDSCQKGRSLQGAACLETGQPGTLSKT